VLAHDVASLLLNNRQKRQKLGAALEKVPKAAAMQSYAHPITKTQLVYL
jgi:hypothetical protein